VRKLRSLIVDRSQLVGFFLIPLLAAGYLGAQTFPRDSQIVAAQDRHGPDSLWQQQMTELVKHMHDQELLNENNTATRNDMLRRLVELEKTLKEVKPDVVAYQLNAIQDSLKEVRASIDHLVLWFLGFVGLGGGGVVYYRNKRNDGGSLDK